MATNELDEIGNRYTSALARAMHDTRVTLLRQLIDDALILPTHSHEVKVDFNGKE